MAKTQVQYGSQGADVKELQKLLNQNGYKLTEDGIFGDNTLKAVKDYQQNNGLSVDGIVGVNTWGALTGGSNATTTSPSTTISAPSLGASPTLPTYDTTKWDNTSKGQAALGAYNTAKEAVTGYGDFTYGNQQQLTDLMTKILNRDKFTYDLNGDALYQQYKDKYIQQGKMAMGDAIGQASAMTGGYGNSYAQSVGQQAYQAQLQNLNDIVPELYQMALDKYNMEGQDLYNQYGMLSDDYAREYGVWNDKYGRTMDAYNIASDAYYKGADMFLTEQSNKNSVAGQTFSDAMDILNRNDTNAWKQTEFEYQQDRDKEEDRQWQADFDRLTANDTADREESNAKDFYTSGGKVGYDNQGISPENIKLMQKALGIEADGKWGPNSKSTSGMTASEAWKAYQNGTLKPKDPEPPEESADDYADWDAADWNSYFAQIRNTEGKSAAEKELERMTKQGLIPQKMLSYAATGARGSLGH